MMSIQDECGFYDFSWNVFSTVKESRVLDGQQTSLMRPCYMMFSMSIHYFSGKCKWLEVPRHFLPTVHKHNSLSPSLSNLYRFPGSGTFSAWSLHVLPVYMWVLSGHSSFLPLPKNMHVRLIGDYKLTLRCLSQLSLRGSVMDWRPVQDVPCLSPSDS